MKNGGCVHTEIIPQVRVKLNQVATRIVEQSQRCPTCWSWLHRRARLDSDFKDHREAGVRHEMIYRVLSRRDVRLKLHCSCQFSQLENPVENLDLTKT